MTFREAFPDIQIEEHVRGLLDRSAVSRVTMNQSRTVMTIYLDCNRLIHREILDGIRDSVRKQLFEGEDVSVRIVERFRLSGQYTAKTLLPMYQDSIFYEIKNYDRILYSLLRTAKIEFTADDCMRLTIPAGSLSDSAGHELARILEKIFTERCGLDLKLELVVDTEKKESERKQLSEKRLAQEILLVSQRAMGRAAGEGDDAYLEVPGRSRASDAKGGASLSAGPAPQDGNAGDYGNGGTLGNADATGNAGNAVNGEYPKNGKAAGTAGLNGSTGAAGNAGKTGNGAKTAKSGKIWNGGTDRAGTSRRLTFRRGSNPDVLFGRDFDTEETPIEQIVEEMGAVVIRGQIREIEFRELRNEKTLAIMAVTDFTDTITVKLFVKNEEAVELKKSLKAGAFVRVKGVTNIDRFDSQLAIGSVQGIKKIADWRVPRMDTAPLKRVELHCHTKMSDMDGISDVKDLIRCAMDWGHEALAITDHGVVQAFTDAAHAIPKDSDFKVIYGCEGYLVDDEKELAVSSKGQSLQGDFVVFDLETTGFSPVSNAIIEIGAVRVTGGKVTDRFSTFVNPKVPIPYRIEELTGIRDDMVMDAPPIEEVLPKFLAFCEGCVPVAHNASFDMSFVRENCARLQLSCPETYVDTVGMARVLLPQQGKYKLDAVAKALGVRLGQHHRAVDDAECTAHIFEKMIDLLAKRDVFDLDALNALGASSQDQIRKLPTYHIILLAKNDVGRVNLYRLVSLSHLKYYSRHPRIPKSLLEKYREGLIIGSACEAGELFQAVVRGVSEQEKQQIASFYDYLEIQPIGNNMFMTREDQKEPKTVEELKEYNREIVRLGERLGKPVCATCDVHFLNPEDSVYRKIIMTSMKFKDAEEQAPLFLRTTEEMLTEFAYLGEEKAREVVITNTVKIAHMCEHIEPVRPDKCPPVIENSDQILTDLCYNKAHEIYGDELPEVVSERLERELNSIISNGFAVMYIIAQKLVWKSNADGYLVGSRGSVGSSFVATMAGITEVNPLSPHYICPACHYTDFDSPEVKKYAGMAGCDMPDAVCPRCGGPLKKEGFDIPFETFLGFKGNKEPDIDLNFSGEYQSKAHKYTEVIFGAGQAFRAGTIGTVADKTAFGYVKGYFEEYNRIHNTNIHKRSCEMARLAAGCVGIRRTTGQHPGGIIVLPYGEEIYSFTPVQHPANDMTTDIVTTHFDYHSIDHNLLKLDILGHDDPTMIRMLEDLTGVNARQIPLDDRQVMTLFQNTEALGITPEQIGGVPTGSLGIPEFGTDFAIQMLVDAKPRYFSDLVRISGLSHGTDVWLGNAQTLIQEGKATISTAICTRDDIMIYLIEKGMDKELSFTIMESVRKGRGLKPEWEEEMVAHEVPDWYIWSCKKIKYMFPKAHAAAYVMMAWRIAWFKINRPLAYYAAYFSIRASGFDYELMCLGKERLLMHMRDYEKRKDSLSNKEQDTYKDMRSVLEMYERGYEFTPIDVYQAGANRFTIVDGKIMPALSSIGGMGAKAAMGIVEAAKDGEFLSREDFRERSGVGKSITDLMGDLGLLKGLPESNQLSLFDLF